ncbi:MAG: hypothetical protein ABEH60_00260 [Halonotius sp.]
MGIVSDLQRLLAGNAADENDAAAPEDDDSDAKTTIDDAEATSLRAIKLPDEERDALDAEDRDS